MLEQIQYKNLVKSDIYLAVDPRNKTALFPTLPSSGTLFDVALKLDNIQIYLIEI